MLHTRKEGGASNAGTLDAPITPSLVHSAGGTTQILTATHSRSKSKYATQEFPRFIVSDYAYDETLLNNIAENFQLLADQFGRESTDVVLTALPSRLHDIAGAATVFLSKCVDRVLVLGGLFVIAGRRDVLVRDVLPQAGKYLRHHATLNMPGDLAALWYFRKHGSADSTHYPPQVLEVQARTPGELVKYFVFGQEYALDPFQSASDISTVATERGHRVRSLDIDRVSPGRVKAEVAKWTTQ